MTEERRKDFESWMSKYKIRSTAILGTGIWMSIHSYLWAAEFAASSILSGVETASIIVAVQGLATFYTGWVFKTYMDGRLK